MPESLTDHKEIIEQEIAKAMPKLKYELVGPKVSLPGGDEFFHIVVRFTVPVPCFGESADDVAYRTRDAARSLAELMFESCHKAVNPATMLSLSRELSGFVDQCVKEGTNYFSKAAENLGY